MRVLFIGGTGIISTGCTRLAAERGIDLTLLTRGQHAIEVPAGVNTIKADINDASAMARVLERESFDVVVDWTVFTTAQLERDIALFRGKIAQYVFISSASAYQKPVQHYLITEATPLENPHWEYSRNKIACEQRLMEALRKDRFPVTICRPSLTYGDTQIPLVMNSWEKPYTVVDRMLKGKKVIVPGDGTSLWTITHNSDFAKGFLGLLGRREAIGEAYHITSDEVRTWDQYYQIVAEALGVEAQIVHIPSDFIISCVPEMEGSLIGDKSVSCVFDNSRIKRLVPDYHATTPFAEGIRRTLAWFSADPARKQIDCELDTVCDKLIVAYEAGHQEAVRRFAPGCGEGH